MDTIIGTAEYIAYGAQLIREGALVAFPTETVYGLGANALDAEAVKKIYAAKGRPTDNPFIVHLAKAEDAALVAEDIPKAYDMLTAAFSPGPLTLILKRKDTVPPETAGGRDTVGVRIPRHAMARQLILASGLPIAAPSANKSGRVSPTLAAHVYEDFAGEIPLILDGGASDVGLESTVLDLTVTPPVILRPGAVTAEMIAQHLPAVITHEGVVLEARSPGMKYAHYEPLCGAVAAATPESAVRCYAQNKEKNPVIIGEEVFVSACAGCATISLGQGAEACMRGLFSALRQAEKSFGLVILERFSDDPAYAAVNNRIMKSAGGKIAK